MLKRAVSGITLTLLLIGMLTLAFNIQPLKADTITICHFDITWEDIHFLVVVETNSTVSSFYFSPSMKRIGFNVTGQADTIGFCSVTIPKPLLSGPWTVLIDAQPALYFTVMENGTHSLLYSLYSHSLHEVQIMGTYVIGATIIVPDDYPTIQEAINAANPGDTIYVKAGIYYENIIVNKTISLIGEDRESTVIDAKRWYTVVLISSANYVTISGFTIRNSGLEYYAGIDLTFADYCNITHNDVTDNLVGILLYGSSNNKVDGNNLKANSGNGISLTSSSNNTIIHNNFINNTNQVYLHQSIDNEWDNGYPSGGNYWSDYTGVDVKSGPNQDQSSSDGIGDTPYVIDENNTDKFPLMQPHYGPVRNLDTRQSYPTIQEGINNATDNDRILVLSGTYYENVVVNKSVSLIGEKPSNTIIDGNGTHIVVRIIANNVTMSKITVQKSAPFYPGIYLLSIHNYIAGNYITNNNHGISIQGSNNVVVGNNLTNNDVGIYVSSYSSNNMVVGNRAANNVVGIRLLGSSNNTVVGNSATNNGAGIGLRGSNFNSIVGNIVTNNEGSGIFLGSSYNNTIVENDALSNYWGIFLSGSSNNTIVENTAVSNEEGIRLSWCSDNTIYHNSFINNKNQAYINGIIINTWDSGYPSGGNHWSDYVGNDDCTGPYQNMTGIDGIFDTAYVMDENNKDRYPLKNPWKPPVQGDINKDYLVDIQDIALAAWAFGSYPDHPRWNLVADMNNDGVVNIYDIFLIARNFGKTA